MSLKQTSDQEKDFLIPTYQRLPVMMVRGEGCSLFDDEGKEYLDFLAGLGVNALGHAHPEILEVLRDSKQTLLHVSNLIYHPYQAEVARRLVRLSGLDRAFFTASGTEAVEGGLKLARAYARKQHRSGRFERFEVLALENSFHGRTAGSLSVTWPEKYRAPFEPLVPGMHFVSPTDVKGLEEQVSSNTCAFLVEVIQGEGGVVPLSREFLDKAQELCRQTGALLICDEIQSGLGRTGQPFAYQKHDLKPDIVLVAKSLAAGLPLGAILAGEKVSQAFQPGSHGSTFGGGPLQCRLAAKFLQILERPGFLDHVREIGDYFFSKLEELQKEIAIVRGVRGEGLMLALILEIPGKEIVGALLDAGFLINCVQEKVLRFLPPLIVERYQVDRLIMTLRKAIIAAEKTTQEK